MIDAGHAMNYDPKAMFHETTKEKLYGAGVAFGEKFAYMGIHIWVFIYDCSYMIVHI